MVVHMKTTVEIADPLLEHAKLEARRRGTTVRALIEEGLRIVLEPTRPANFTLRPAAVSGVAPSRWDELQPDERLAVMYGDR